MSRKNPPTPVSPDAGRTPEPRSDGARPPLVPSVPGTSFSVAMLDRERGRDIDLALDAGAIGALADVPGVSGIREVHLSGRLSADGAAGWRFDGRLRAKLDQTCVVTLAPLVQEVDEPVARVWDPAAEPPAGAEEEIGADTPDLPEPLGETIELVPVVLETLALAADPYPRADGATLDQALFGPADARPLTDEAARPFAALAALKARMSGED